MRVRDKDHVHTPSAQGECGSRYSPYFSILGAFHPQPFPRQALGAYTKYTDEHTGSTAIEESDLPEKAQQVITLGVLSKTTGVLVHHWLNEDDLKTVREKTQNECLAMRRYHLKEQHLHPIVQKRIKAAMSQRSVAIK